MVIDFSKISIDEKPVLLLKTLDGTTIQVLGHAFNITGDLSYNEISVLEFCIPSSVDGVEIPYYNDITGMKIIDLVGCGQFILVNPKEESDGVRKVKTCKAYSLEYEFAKKEITLDKGTYCFWNALSPNNTILGRILERMPDWKIGSVDTSLIGKYRTFEDLTENAYDFIKSKVQKSYGCIFDFDTYNRRINIVSTSSVIPIKQVYLTNNQLIKKVEIEETSDEIITCLDVNGADGVTIRSVNPTGTNKIYNLDYFLNTTNFPQELIDKWRQWEQEVQAYQEIYYNTTVDYNLQLATKTTEEAALTTLYGEMTSLENQRAVTIQAIAQGLETSSALSSITSKILNKKNQITTKKAHIASLQADMEELRAVLVEINNKVRMEDYFTLDEFSMLNKYFFEETLQDSSFVVAKQETYDNNDISNTLKQAPVVISGGSVKTTNSDTGKIIYNISDGTLSIGSLSATIIKATMIVSDDDSFVFTAYLNHGKINSESFVSGSISAIGVAQNITSSTSDLSFIADSCTMYFTKNTTEYEQHSVEWDLYEYGKEFLAQKSVASYHFSVECGNFFSLKDFIIFKNEFEFGNKVYLKIDNNDPIQPYATAIHINYEDASDFSIEFSSDYTVHSKGFNLSQLIEQSVSMGKTLSSKSGVYSEFVNSGASNRVKEFMESALDVAKNTVLSSGEQAYEIGDAGIRLRKWADEEHTEYSDEQIWLVNNMIAFTTDNWNTASMAIGKIFDENLKSESNPTGMAYGIVSQYLVGTIVAGNNLIISTDNGAFRVDSNGVYIDALKFYITHDGQDYDTTLEDELGKISEETIKIIEENNKTLTQIIDSNGYIKAGLISGIIDATKSQMQSSSGNVLFDSDGLWLMNKSTKSATTKAIWMNENGVLFGTGAASNDPANSADWTWTTAIDHDGIVAEALAGKKLSACEIYGGYININDNFIVDSFGNLTANNGIFRGTVDGVIFQDVSGNSMMDDNYQFTSDYLNLKGLKITNGSGDITFEVDSEGNIAMRGNIYMGAGSSINWSEITETGDKPYATSNDIKNALGEYVTKSEVNASIDTYLNSSTGQAAIVTSVSGVYQTKSDMGNYATKADLDGYMTQTDLNAQIGAYLDTSAGIAKITNNLTGVFVKEDSLGNYVTKTELNSGIESYIDTSTGKAKVVSACSGVYVSKDDLGEYVDKSTLTAEIGAYIDTQAGTAKIANNLAGTFVTEEALGSYVKTTDLSAGIESYIDTSTGKAKVVSAVSGTYVTQTNLNTKLNSYPTTTEMNSALSGYVKTTNLNSSIGTYIDSATGTAKVVSAASGTYQTISGMSEYAKTSAITTIEQSVSDVEASITLSSSYSKDTIGTNVYALLQLVSNANSSSIKIKADKIDFTGFTTFLRASDLGSSGSTTIDGGRITTGTISADRIDVSSLKVNTIYGKGSYSYYTAMTTDSTNLYVGGGSFAPSYTNVYLAAKTKVYFGSTGVFEICVDVANDSIYSTFVASLCGTSSYPWGEIHGGGSSSYHIVIADTVIRPSASSTYSSYSLGTSTYPWNAVYTKKLYLNGTEFSGGSNFAGSLVNMGGTTTYYIQATTSRQLCPNTSSTTYPFYLGTSGYYWHYAYIGSVAAYIGSSASSKLGFFGTTPVARQTVSSSATVATLITALKAYGLIY